MRSKKTARSLLTVVCAVSLAACSVQRYALNALSGVLASGDTAVERDDDPVLVGQALPFTLKLIDSVLLQQPDDRALLLAGARGYVLYGYAFVSLPAERISRQDIDVARPMRARARALFMRAHAYASRALQLDYPDIDSALRKDPKQAVSRVGGKPQRDVQSLYWTAVSLGLAISVSKNDPKLLARLPELEALLDRALALDEAWGDGALHELAIQLGPVTRIGKAALQKHYQRALALSGGKRASLFVAYGEAVALPDQDRADFVRLLNRALAVDVDAYPDQRLLNVLAQQQARWLLSRLDELFL